jgi:hypothetical protein
MSMSCGHCQGSGFLNIEQVPDEFQDRGEQVILDWMKSNPDSDVQICDCCGDSIGWYGVPGEHYNNDDPSGKNGPYAGNGGLCRCH